MNRKTKNRAVLATLLILTQLLLVLTAAAYGKVLEPRIPCYFLASCEPVRQVGGCL